MKYLSDNLLRKDLNLEKRWWHRLAKSFFITFSVVILLVSISGFYFAEENSAREYKVVQNFKNFMEIEQKTLVENGVD